MNQFVLQTDGTWEGTIATLNGVPISPSQLRIQLFAGRNEYGEVAFGGCGHGGELEGYFLFADAPEVPQSLFPGTVQLVFPNEEIILEHPSPFLDVCGLTVRRRFEWISDKIVDLLVEVNADTNTLFGQLSLYQLNLLGPDEILTLPLVG
jgi:hypothetical protein